MADGNSDIDLIRGLKVGEQKAWKALFVRYWSTYVRFVEKIVGERAAAKDIVQDMFLKLWANRSRMDEESSVGKLLYVIARNASLNFLRDRKQALPVENLEDREDGNLSADDRIAAAEMNRALSDAVEALSERRKSVIKKKLGGGTNKDISKELGLSEKTVERHVTLARSDLKDKIRFS